MKLLGGSNDEPPPRRIYLGTCWGRTSVFSRLASRNKIISSQYNEGVMIMIVHHYEDTEAVEIMEGVRKRVVIGEKEGAPTFIMRIFDLDPGKSSPFHIHPWEHEIFVLKGTGAATNDEGKQIPLSEGNTIFVPADEKHSLTNTGGDIFRFMCLIPMGVEESMAKNVE
jgi:quercetin dioxygenase-like cupin family protein